MKEGHATQRTYSTSAEKSTGFGDKPIDEGLAALPVVNRYVENVADEAESCERTVQKQREQAAVVLLIWKRTTKLSVYFCHLEI